jgi:hypothetical protein
LGFGDDEGGNYALTFRSLQIIMKLIINLYWKDIQPLLLRYTTDESGKTAVQAEIYTKDDHGIGKEKIDPDAYMITRRLRQLDFEAYIVGGAVRDLLLGREPKDYDIATNATPRQLKRIFSRSRIIGRRFRLVHVYFRGMKFIEVATFRSGAEGDANTFGTLEEDVRRRDFSLNALYYCPRDEYIIDHVGGLQGHPKRRLENVIPLGSYLRRRSGEDAAGGEVRGDHRLQDPFQTVQGQSRTTPLSCRGYPPVA